MDFVNPMSAVGFDFMVNSSNDDLVISLFNSSDVLLETQTIDSSTLPILAGFGNPFGFVGVDVGASDIAYATVQGTTNPRVILDNFIYQSDSGGSPASSVPLPATLALMGLGLVGLGFAQRRKRV